jgi:O-methyltransferase
MVNKLKQNTKQFFLKRGYQVDRLHPLLVLKEVARRMGYALTPLSKDFPLYPPISGQDLLILKDVDFQKSVAAVEKHTLLDVARLANLWNLVRLTGPGKILEVGTFRGGGALHISNACPEREIFVFDSFEGFRSLKPGLDDIFGAEWFKDASVEVVQSLFRPFERNVRVVKGFFPDSAAGIDLESVSFCHLDVDVYEATRDALFFLADRLAPRSLIVLDDFQRGAHGLDQAVKEFLAVRSEFIALPMFPGQAVVLSCKLWNGGGA